MFKLDLEKAEEPELKLPTSGGSLKKQENSIKKNICFCFTDYVKAFDYVDHNTLENSSRNGNTRPSYLPPEKSVCRLKSNRTGHGTKGWFQIGKGVCQGCILSPCLFKLYAVYIIQTAGLDEAHAGIKIAGRNINNLRYADNTTLMAESMGSQRVRHDRATELTELRVATVKLGKKKRRRKEKKRERRRRLSISGMGDETSL